MNFTFVNCAVQNLGMLYIWKYTLDEYIQIRQKILFSLETLQNHILQNHSGSQYQCSRCPKSFTSAQLRRQHKINSHGEKTEVCGECGKMFANKATLKHHTEQVHIKEKDKICPLCGEYFFALISFKAHVLRHTNDRQFSCKVCAKAFLQDKDLERHMGTHTLPFSCDQCAFKFSTNSLLKDHVKMKHRGMKRSCRFGCGWDAWQSWTCSKHEKSCLLNPLPGAPYSVAVGRASSLTLQRYQLKMRHSEPQIEKIFSFIYRA